MKNRRKAMTARVAFMVFAVVLMHLSAASAENYGGTNEEINQLITENRKLAAALADATDRILKMKEDGGDCIGLDAAQQQNDSLRETIKAQNEALAHCGGAASAGEEILALKETVRQLTAQNEHLSSAGTMGKTVTNQMIALQDRIDELEKSASKAQQNEQVLRNKIKEYERKKPDCPAVASCNVESEVDAIESIDTEKLNLSKEITALRLENQELKARLELLEKKP